MRVAIIGTGYVGLTTGVALAFLGHDVCCVDRDARKIALLQDGKSPIHEHGIEHLMRTAEKRLTYTQDLAGAVADREIVIIAVGTPSQADGGVDCSYVEDAASEVGAALTDGRRCTIVVKSTVPVGANRRVENQIRRQIRARGLTCDLGFASNPEFLREGKAMFDTLYPDRIVLGATGEASEAMRKLYAPILNQTFTAPGPIPRPNGFRAPSLVMTDRTSAEMIKYASNAFLAVKISYINEFAGLCDLIGADIKAVAKGMGLDSRIGAQFLNAGVGWGGSCFPKDTAALISQAAEAGYTMPIVEAAREVNDRQRQAIVTKLQTELKALRGRRVGVLGLAFKPDTDDVRDAPSVAVIRLLHELGAHIRVHDPIALDNAKLELSDLPVEYETDPYKLAADADAVILITEWREYRDLDLAKLASSMAESRVLLDGRNVFDPALAREAGLRYVAIGRGV